jgi:uncharacterized protein DUF1707
MANVSESSEIRIGDTEREAALKALGEHLSAGRIDIDEYGERSAQVTAARTRGDLRGLFTDLPEPHPVLGGAEVPLAGTAPVPASQPGPGQPDGTVVRPSGAGQVARGTAGALTSVAWLGAIVLIAFAHVAWPVIFIPIALSAVFGSVWGKHWNKGHDWRDDRERYRRERRGER